MGFMKVVGITGGIGSGKSVVSKLLEINDIPVYNTDIAAKKIHDISQTVREKLSARFGSELYEPYGLLNRPMLAALIFSHPENRDFVHSVVHPAVEEDFLEWKTAQEGRTLLGIESALLFESGLKRWIDLSINVSAPLEIRILRTQKRDHLDREAVLSRIRNQISEEERSALADYTFINDDRQALLPQVENWLKFVKSE
ncbi:MAG: dephospho-CoA kinase [Dysgonamonadaceae bacterium]|jgi:dephospho-CoA kinase|nr:dephospho-CoA kinase [Dysgonamonadaceae bacterium]